MKKFISFTISLLLIFTFLSPSIVYAKDNKKSLLNKVELELDSIEEQLDNMDLSDEEVEDLSMDFWIDEAITYSEDLDNPNISNFSIFDNIGNKIENTTNFIRKQYELKTKYINNTKDTYILSKNIKDNFSHISKELKYIFNSEYESISEEDFYNILKILKSINLNLKKSNYNAADVLKESSKYIRLVFKFNITEATKTFENIVNLQNNRLILLNNINDELLSINNILDK